LRARSRRGRNNPSLTRVAAASLVALVAAFAVAPVLLSHDVYSYVDYARLGVLHGLDPYVYPPAAEPFDPAYAHVTWIDATSAYGPLFTLATYPLAWLPVWWAVAALKAIAALSVLAIALLVARIAPSRGVSPLGAAAFVALNPLVLIHAVGGAHNDALAMLAATIGVAAMLNAREASAGAAFVAAFAIKAPAALAAPFALVSAKRFPNLPPYSEVKSASAPRIRHSPHWRGVKVGYPFAQTSAWRFLLGVAIAALAIGLASFAAFGWNWLDALGLAGENQHRTTQMSIPTAFARLTGLGPTAVRIAALALFALALAYLLIRTWRGMDWLRAGAWASFALLLATAWLLPWYLIWALPSVALSRDRPLQFLTLALTAYQLPARMPL
jgi:alpha-1,6-mannosyltransferase